MKISVVVPIYCEERNIRSLYSRLEKIAVAAPDLAWEYVFVNDGSSDGSMTVLRQLAMDDTKVKVVDLSKNFGKEAALTAGLQFSSGDATVCLDADLQHPPELIPQLIEEWKLGAEVVATIRTGTDEE